jgi:transposase
MEERTLNAMNLFTIHDLAERWQVSLRTVQRWCRRHRILRPVLLSKHSPRWRPQQIELFEKRQARDSRG